MMMKTYEFTIIASGLDTEADDFEDHFYGAGCDDATVAVVKGKIVLEFAREARNFSHALASAIADVRKGGAKIERIEPDYLVSLSDIAQRSDLSRQAVSLYAAGKREKGFPQPVARVTTDTPLWDWVEVAKWMFKKRKLSLESLLEARMVQEANAAIADATVHFEETPFAHKMKNIIAREDEHAA